MFFAYNANVCNKAFDNFPVTGPILASLSRFTRDELLELYEQHNKSKSDNDSPHEAAGARYFFIDNFIVLYPLV